LENDIDVNAIITMAEDFDFTGSSIKLISNLGIMLDQYNELTTGDISEGLKNHFLHHLHDMMVNKSIFYLFKGDPLYDSRSPDYLAHSITVDKSKFKIAQGESIGFKVEIKNEGDAEWLNENIQDVGVVKIGTHLYSSKGNLIDLDYSRHAIPHRILPGETFSEWISIRFPMSGKYYLVVDLVSENICWFENVGSKPVKLKVLVS
jgi:hypothetical protein